MNCNCSETSISKYGRSVKGHPFVAVSFQYTIYEASFTKLTYSRSIQRKKKLFPSHTSSRILDTPYIICTFSRYFTTVKYTLYIRTIRNVMVAYISLVILDETSNESLGFFSSNLFQLKPHFSTTAS